MKGEQGRFLHSSNADILVIRERIRLSFDCPDVIIKTVLSSSQHSYSQFTHTAHPLNLVLFDFIVYGCRVMISIALSGAIQKRMVPFRVQFLSWFLPQGVPSDFRHSH